MLMIYLHIKFHIPTAGAHYLLPSELMLKTNCMATMLFSYILQKRRASIKFEHFSKINTHTSFQGAKVSVASITPIPQVLVIAIFLLLIVEN
jgi:hypothetical protein